MVHSPWSMLLLCSALLALRKPWALHTPQFWAEDGEIFMKQDDAWGAGAFLTPYNGYLHLLPRLIAWIASHTADVAWWPAIYNWSAFAISVALFARMASPRVELPAKPWLMLALVLVVGTGEVLLNVTNLQWFAAFFLVLHLFTARPTTLGQRLGDLLILLVIGLNGPFAIVFAPLFAWRAWRAASPRTTDQGPETKDPKTQWLDVWLEPLAVGACAVVQGWLVTHTNAPLSLHEGPEKFRLGMMLSVIGSRLITWPVFGPAAVKAWPLWAHAILGSGVIGALVIWALRADPRRAVRAPLVVAFTLITVACAYRSRADTWQDDNLVNGDRYFYISRVLIAWLVILECDARPRAVRYAARAVCVVAILMHAPRFILAAPPDYKWAEHCDPIRRGVPANIYTLPEGWWIEYPGRPPKK